MKLFHSFPRPKLSRGSRAHHDLDNDAVARAVLRSILYFGLLCTPERLKIYPDRLTSNPAKIALREAGEPEFVHPQSRFCMTLCTPAELFERKIRGITAGKAGPVPLKDSLSSHADLFGPYAVSFDPVKARRMGIVPTNYFSPNDIFGERYAGDAPGLNIQMIQRLKEIRELLILLAMIEQSLEVSGHRLPGQQILEALDLKLPYETEVVQRIVMLNDEKRRKIFELFDTDREIALNLVSTVEMMLSLYQETDSSIDGSVLAFYQQREWRLIHHVRMGMIWYCLGNQPAFRNPHAAARKNEIAEVRNIILQASLGAPRDESYFKQCWLLEKVDDLPIRDFIAEVIAPAKSRAAVLREVRNVGCSADVVAAEDLGYRP